MFAAAASGTLPALLPDEHRQLRGRAVAALNHQEFSGKSDAVVGLINAIP